MKSKKNNMKLLSNNKKKKKRINRKVNFNYYGISHELEDRA